MIRSGKIVSGGQTGVDRAGLDVAITRPCLVIDLNASPAPETVSAWLAANRIRLLNIAGPRESGCPGIHDEAAKFLRMFL